MLAHPLWHVRLEFRPPPTLASWEAIRLRIVVRLILSFFTIGKYFREVNPRAVRVGPHVENAVVVVAEGSGVQEGRHRVVRQLLGGTLPHRLRVVKLKSPGQNPHFPPFRARVIEVEQVNCQPIHRVERGAFVGVVLLHDTLEARQAGDDNPVVAVDAAIYRWATAATGRGYEVHSVTAQKKATPAKTRLIRR